MSDAFRQRLHESLGGAFTVERELGGGGMSRVFVARDEALGRHVVVKVLAPELAQGLSAERFTREIRLAAALQEPHIVPVLAAGSTADGLPWYTMPFVEGESLRARLERGALPVDEAVSILRDVARALAYAHARGIVHRDIKPENVLLSSGTAVVTDFGIAKALSASKTQAPGGTLTQIGTSLGTPAYMAPEQATGDDVDARADIYAWGVVAYELLAGRHPFADRTTAQQLIAAHISEVPAAVSQIAPAVPAPLAALVLRALAKDRAQRPSDAAALLAALDGTTVTGSSSASTALPHARRKTIVAVLAGGVLIAATAAFALLSRDGPSSPVAPAVTSLAVLPFENVGGDTSQTYFVDGMTDELATMLARIPELAVTARTSSYAFRNRQGLALGEIARRLNVGAVLEGSVQRAGTQLRVRAQLTRATDQRVLWTDAFTQEAGDVFAVQARLAQSIADAVAPALLAGGSPAGTRVAEGQGTQDPEAYDLYLRARYELNQRGAGVRRAIALFEQALERDPAFVRAWAGLASAWAVLPYYDAALGERAAMFDEVLAPTRRAAQGALALDSLSGEAHTALGYAYSNLDSLARAEPLLRRGVELAPGSVDAHGWLSSLYDRQGRPDLAERESRAALALDPMSGLVLTNLAGVVHRRGAVDEARALARRAVAVDPHNVGTLRNAVGILTKVGEFGEALALLDRLPANEGLPNLRLFALVGTGRRDSVEAIARRLRAATMTRRDSSLLTYAEAALGRWDAVLDLMEASAVRPRAFPEFRPLARHPRFLPYCRRLRSESECAALIGALEALPAIPLPGVR